MGSGCMACWQAEYKEHEHCLDVERKGLRFANLDDSMQYGRLQRCIA